MKKNKKSWKANRSAARRRNPSKTKKANALFLPYESNQAKKHLEKMRESHEKLLERMEDAEIHINLLTRLLTIICVEKLGMRIGVLKRLLKRVEKEAIRDSQILHLENLYSLSHYPEKKPSQTPHHPKSDPWEDIS